MKKYDVVIATEGKYLNPVEADWCSDQVLLEDQLVIEAFARHGMKAIRMDWASESFDWSSTKGILIRAVWDYHTRFDEFKRWALRANETSQLFNSSAAVMWNMDKIYMQEMKSLGVHIAPTIFFDKDESLDIREVVSTLNWNKFVLKPRISAGARNTIAFSRNEIDEQLDSINSLFKQEDMMIQEFQNSIVSQGEVSIMMFGDQYSHAVIKNAVPGDFRVQDDFGGSVHQYVPAEDEIEFAKSVISACPHDTVYARVDYFRDNSGQLALGELEIIEPELWFRENDQAADLLAKELKRWID